MGKLYKEDSIESLSPLEFTRLRPGVYAGDTTYSTQLLVEILSNAIDEFRLGNGHKIEIFYAKDRFIFRMMDKVLFLILTEMMEKPFLKRLLAF